MADEIIPVKLEPSPYNTFDGFDSVLIPVIVCVADKDALEPINDAVVVAKLGSFPNAVANSFSVSRVDGADATNDDICEFT